MRLRTCVNVASVILVATAPAMMVAQAPPPPATEVGAAALAMATVPAKSPAKIKVSTPAWKDGGDIPFENTQYKGNTFPGLSWSAGPAGTKSYAIIMQDGDGARNGVPYLHWTMFNVPASTTKLAAGMTAVPTGAQYGQNYKGLNQAYLGPRTPAGPKHRYHIQIFALDNTLALDDKATYADITGALKDHVLASGELIGLGQVMTPPSN